MLASRTQVPASIETSVRRDISESQAGAQPERHSPTDEAVKKIWAQLQLEAITHDLGNLSLYSSRFEDIFTLLSEKIAQAGSEEDLNRLLHILQTESSKFILFASEHPSQETLKFSKLFVQLINLRESLCRKAPKHLFHEYVIEMAKFGLQSIPLARKDIATQLQEVLELLISITPSNDPNETFSVQRWIVPLSHAGRQYLNIIIPSIQNDDQLLTIVYQNLIKAAFPMHVSEFRPLLGEALGKAVDRFTERVEKYFRIHSYKTFCSFLDDTTSIQINMFLGVDSVAVTIRQHRNSDIFEISACWMGWRPYSYDADMLPVFASMTGITLKSRTLRKGSLEVAFEAKDEEQMHLVCRVINDINEVIIESSKRAHRTPEPYFFKILNRILNNLSSHCSYKQIRTRIFDEVWKQFEQTKQLPLFFMNRLSPSGQNDIREYLREKQLIEWIVAYVTEELTSEQPKLESTEFFARVIFPFIPVEKKEKIYTRYFLDNVPRFQDLEEKFIEEDPDLQNRICECLWNSCKTTTKAPDRLLYITQPMLVYAKRNQLLGQIKSVVAAELSGALPRSLYSKLFTNMTFHSLSTEDRMKIYFHSLFDKETKDGMDSEIVRFLCDNLVEEKEGLYLQVFQAILNSRKLPNPIVKNGPCELTNAVFEYWVAQDPSIQQQVIDELTGKTSKTEFRDLFLTPALSKLTEQDRVRFYVENLSGPAPLLPDQIEYKDRHNVFTAFVDKNKQKAIEYFRRYEKDNVLGRALGNQAGKDVLIDSFPWREQNKWISYLERSAGIGNNARIDSLYACMEDVEKASEWLDKLIKRLGQHASPQLCQGFDKDLNTLNQLATKDYSSFEELEDARTKFGMKFKTFKADVQTEAIACATKMPLPEKRNYDLLEALFPGEVSKINDFIEQNLKKLLTDLIINESPVTIPLVEGERTVAILMAFYEKEERQVYILRHLDLGKFKDVNRGFCLVGSGPGNFVVIDIPQILSGDVADLSPELIAMEHLKSEYILEVKPIVDPKAEHPFGLVEEYCDGGSLAEEIYSATFPRSPESFMKSLDYSIELAQALEEVHEANIVHLDVKPSNVLLKLVNGKKCVRLIDFGLWLYTGRLKNKHFGTTGYVPLEMFQKENWWTSATLDMWSFGITLLELFCGLEANSIRQEIEKDKEGFRKLQPPEQVKIIESAYKKMLANLDKQLIPESLKQLIKSLVSRKAKSRPTASQARKQLEIIRNNPLI